MFNSLPSRSITLKEDKLMVVVYHLQNPRDTNKYLVLKRLKRDAKWESTILYRQSCLSVNE